MAPQSQHRLGRRNPAHRGLPASPEGRAPQAQTDRPARPAQTATPEVMGSPAPTGLMVLTANRGHRAYPAPKARLENRANADLRVRLARPGRLVLLAP